MLRKAHTEVNRTFLQVQQIQVDAFVEFAVIECKVELARRVEKHDLVVGVEK
jgi:hypothetical protein